MPITNHFMAKSTNVEKTMSSDWLQFQVMITRV